MPILPVNENVLGVAVERLRQGDLVGMPTETVYGLAADATNSLAVARIYERKGRPQFNPLIAHVSNVAMARREAHLDQRAEQLMQRFWPGPLTLVVPIASDCSVCDLARAGLSTIALRMPNHPTARALIEGLNRPIAAPSANRSGHVSPTTAADVAFEFGKELLILDAGPCVIGVESTIVELLPEEPARLLRPGGITREELLAVLGKLDGPGTNAVNAPGQLQSHYAPRARLRLNAVDVREGEVFLGFGPTMVSGGENLSARGDLKEAAANLFTLLRRLDEQGANAIAVAPVPETSLGEAINDRLRRAAAPREGEGART